MSKGTLTEASAPRKAACALPSSCLPVTLFFIMILSSVCCGASSDHALGVTWRDDFRRDRIESRHTTVATDNGQDVRKVGSQLSMEEYRLKGLRIHNARYRQGENIRYRRQHSESMKLRISREPDIQTGRALGTQGAKSALRHSNKN